MVFHILFNIMSLYLASLQKHVLTKLFSKQYLWETVYKLSERECTPCPKESK